ncbi:MAG: bifunctional GlcG/HbpS family heme-binding protein/cupin domain-containing protein [Gemmatimonadales bacterium]
MNRIKTLLAIAPLIALTASGLSAQLANRKQLTADGAKSVAEAVIAEATRLNTTGVVAVVDDGGNLMYLARIDGTFAAGAMISYGKARTAALFKRPTAVFEKIIRDGRTPMVALNDFTPLKGGVPVEVDGQIVGAVGVSGAASAEQDDELAAVGAKALGGMKQAMAAPVSIFPKAQVDAGFSQGGVLIGDMPDRGYQVHTSRRDKPGVVEVHSTDTDVFYVLSGSATLVTGGTMTGGKEIGPNEWRGEGIEGGETRKVAKGDVVVIPAGTPHWFKQIDGPVTYYAVKAR